MDTIFLLSRSEIEPFLGSVQGAFKSSVAVAHREGKLCETYQLWPWCLVEKLRRSDVFVRLLADVCLRDVH